MNYLLRHARPALPEQRYVRRARLLRLPSNYPEVYHADQWTTYTRVVIQKPV